jgi:hypothetical protein
MTRKRIIILRLILWLILVIILGWFIYLKIVPNGKISYVDKFNKLNYFIGKLSPAERVKLDNGQAEIKGDPVYFSLNTPRRFEKASVYIKFKNTTDFPVMEIGLLNDKVAWGYDLKPLENKIIDQLSSVWPVIYGQNGERLIQREKKYDSVKEFLDNLVSDNQLSEKTAVYNYNIKRNFLLPNYSAGQNEQSIDYNFRGSFQFYTYVKNEDLNFVFDFIDLNINKDNDPVDVKVYNSEGLIKSEHVADDQMASSERQVKLRIPDLKEGVYRLSFIASDDVITKNIISKQSQFSIINKVWLAGSGEKNIILFTNSRSVSAQTINPASLTKIKVGDSLIDLTQTYKQFSQKVTAWPARIELNKNDIIISGDGVFSFNQNNLLDPRFKTIDNNTNINQEKIDYIIADFNGPKSYQGWQIAQADFDLTRGYQENSKYQFLISVPGLKAEDPHKGEIIIEEIKIELFGTSLKQKLDKILSR